MAYIALIATYLSPSFIASRFVEVYLFVQASWPCKSKVIGVVNKVEGRRVVASTLPLEYVISGWCFLGCGGDVGEVQFKGHDMVKPTRTAILSDSYQQEAFTFSIMRI